MQYSIVHRPAFRMAAIMFILVTVFACNRKIAFNTSPVVPTAVGDVRIKKDNNGNHTVKVDVKHLADPKRLPIPQNTYMVWAETPDGVRKLGQLKTGSSLISSTLRASMETVTPYKPSRVYITAESDTGVQYPGSQVVLTTGPI